MPWTRLNPAVVVQQLRVQHGPGDEAAAEQALAHLRAALLSGAIAVQNEVAETRIVCRWAGRLSASKMRRPSTSWAWLGNSRDAVHAWVRPDGGGDLCHFSERAALLTQHPFSHSAATALTRRMLPLLLAFHIAPARAQMPEDLLRLLRSPGSVGLLRHARAPGTGDPPGFRLGDCATQRNLDAAGREQAREIGMRLREAGVRAGVFSSAWCRTCETAELLDMGPVEILPALNSFFGDGSEGPEQTATVRRFLRSHGQEPVILVTHQVNVTALTGVYPGDGEMVVMRPRPDGHVVAGRLTLARAQQGSEQGRRPPIPAALQTGCRPAGWLPGRT